MKLQQDTLFDDRYLLKKVLGCGGFSEVWLVEDTKVSNKLMALKIYAPDKGLDDDGVALFSSEFELVFDLNHTHLLRPAHFDVCERSPYLLMPYCEHGSVSKYAGRLTEEDAWHILHDVAAGLAYLHEQDPPIIHQDIKPDNILKDHRGHYQITDFGISTKVRSTLRKSMNSAQSAGTLAYMPPERFGKDNMPVKASDIWAMGATVFELLTGDVPFSEHGGLVQKSGAEIPNMPENLSNNLQEIIIRCLHKDPWDRPIAQQVVDWTEKYFRGEEIIFESKEQDVKPVSKSNLHSPPLINNKKILWIIAGGVLGLILVFFIVKSLIPTQQKNNSIQVSENTWADNEDIPAESFESEADLMDSTDSMAESDPEESIISPQATARDSSSPPAVPTWINDYNRILDLAQSAYNSKNYVGAKAEYTRALTLANRNGDRQKETFVNEKIIECDKAIAAATEAATINQKEIQDRLAAYNFVGNFKLGSSHMIVQRKSNNRWGIINMEGVVVEEFNYTQVSTRLKNDYYALKNDNGWVVFNTSLEKIAVNLENTNGYR